MSHTSEGNSRMFRVWDLGVRLFHWLLVVVIALAFLSSEEESALWLWHIPLGWSAALLIAFRLVWGLVGGEHARFANFVRPTLVAIHIRHMISGKLAPSMGHNPLGALAVVALLGFTLATIITGAFGGEDAHEAIAYGLLALVAIHVAAVLLMSHLTKDNLILAMLTGNKRADRFPEAHDALPPGRIAAPIAAIAVGAVAFGVTLVDPKAFTPHPSAETDENEEQNTVNPDVKLEREDD